MYGGLTMPLSFRLCVCGCVRVLVCVCVCVFGGLQQSRGMGDGWDRQPSTEQPVKMTEFMTEGWIDCRFARSGMSVSLSV